MKHIITIVLSIAVIIGIIAFSFTINQADQEETRLSVDLQHRSTLLAESLRETVEPNFINKSDQYLQSVVERFANRERLAGLAIYDNKGKVIAISSSLPKENSESQKIITDSMDGDKANGSFVKFADKKMYIFTVPLHDKSSVVGALMVAQNAEFIDTRLNEIWRNNVTRILIQIIFLSIAAILFLRFVIFKPLQSLVESIKQSGSGNNGLKNNLGNSIFQPLFGEISNMKKSLIEARLAASEEARMNLERLDSPWTKERLSEFVRNILKNRKIIIASNTEPLIHSKQGSKIESYMPSSGAVTALEPVMKACGGIWVAWGSGNADKLSVDKNDKVNLPSDDPKYKLKRIWLNDKEVQNYYNGFSNEGLWPLCHNSHTRPIFRKEDWEEYKNVNLKFAQSVLEEIKNLKKPVILVQDYHLTLVPKMIKDARPDATINIFWHIPWISAETFSICPWKREILEGMLGSDLLGFHTQLHVNNFIETVERELESLVNFEQFSITHKEHTSYLKAFPISIDFYNDIKPTKNDPTIKENIYKEFGIKTKYLGVGVERLDYTKGILEKFKGIEIFLKKYPGYRRHFTFLQIASPSRIEIKRYQDFARDVRKEAERINEIYKEKDWKPIIFIEKRYDRRKVSEIYKAANFCIVTSLHDGMNLVAKEFVAARNDEQGVLILSQFAGASRELKEAIIINPYNGEQTAESIHEALKMPIQIQRRNMKKLRQTVRNYNVYRWSAEILKSLVNLS